MPTQEQIKAFAAITEILQPSTMSSISANGTRETWKKIDEWINVLIPLFLDTEKEDLTTP